MEHTELMKHTGPEAGFTDFHTHILPGMDDGSPDVETSEKMLESLKRQGVGTVVLTPHFYTDRESPSDFLRRRDASLEKLLPTAEGSGMRIYPACELYFTDYIFNCEDLSPLCIRSGRYLLTELPFFCDFSGIAFDRIARLIADGNVVPILAHIERYERLMRDRDCLERLIGLGCLAQVNLDSLADSRMGRRRVLLDYLRDGLVHAVGTDCHNMTARPPRFLDGMEVVLQKAGASCVDGLERNARRILPP